MTKLHPILFACAALSGLAPASSLHAAASQPDCAPLGSLPTYAASEDGPTRRDYNAFDFNVGKADGSGDTTRIAGRFCQQHYEPKDGTEPLSNLEILDNYRAQAAHLGAGIVFSDDNDIVGKLTSDGHETWFKVYSEETAIDVTVVDKQPHRQVLTGPSGNDYPLLGHMPNYVAGAPEKRNFDQLDFAVDDGAGGSNSVTVQGAKYTVSYMIADGAQPNSNLDILENYRTALQQMDAQILFADDNNLDARLQHDGKSIWIKVYSEDTEIHLDAIEEKAFAATIQPASADALKAALDKDGHVALYVNFDFNKASLRPDAKPVIAQVVALLQANPDLKLDVSGNTDNIGTHDYNVKLSGERAASVVAALVQAGIAADRLHADGNGPDKPIADNTSAEGRARNRRVELVKM